LRLLLFLLLQFVLLLLLDVFLELFMPLLANILFLLLESSLFFEPCFFILLRLVFYFFFGYSYCFSIRQVRSFMALLHCLKELLKNFGCLLKMKRVNSRVKLGNLKNFKFNRS
jgi:hypothetical protein